MLEYPELPTPQDFGFPVKPDATQVLSWQRQESFLDAFAACGSVGAAATAAGIPLPTVESWATNDTHGFKRRKELAKLSFLGVVEAEINRRAIQGIEKPIFNTKGEQTGSTWQYSDNLLMFRAKRLDPEYRDTPRPTQQPGAVAVTKIIINLAPGVEPPAEIVEATEYHEVEGDTPGISEQDEDSNI